MRAKHRSRCPLCTCIIEPGEKIQHDEEYGWIHGDCTDEVTADRLRSLHAPVERDESPGMGYSSADEAADDFWIFHD